MEEFIESPEVMEIHELHTACRHRPSSYPTASRNLSVVEYCVKLQVEVPAKVLVVWIFDLLAD